jgi:DNA-binding transcriptional ArsR family regulator
MHTLDVVGDPVRRRLLELLSDGERTAGALSAVVESEHRITQPAVSRHLRVLRESGLVTVRSQGARRLYAVNPTPLEDAEAWLRSVRDYWNQRLDALATEIPRGGATKAGED